MNGDAQMGRKASLLVLAAAVTCMGPSGCGCSENGAADGGEDMDLDGTGEGLDDVRPEDLPPDGESDPPPDEIPDAPVEELDAPEREVPPPCDPSNPFREERGDLEPGDALVEIELEECAEHAYVLVAAEGMILTVTLASDRVHPVRAALVYPDEVDWSGPIETLYSGWEPAETGFNVPRSGEFFILVRGADPRYGLTYDLGVECTDGCDLETTRFPVVMVHGWTGFADIGPIDYFYGVYDHLTSRGYLLYIAELDPYNSTEIRSEQLAAQVDGFLEEGRARKVNLVAHSQGGLDSRRVVSTLGYGDRVGAVATVATPHQGTPITDIALGILPGSHEEALYFLLNLLGATATGREQEARDSFACLSEEYVRNTFNPENPDDPRVQYISWTGLTCLLGITCDDVCDVEIRWSYNLIYLERGDNDGMVPVSSGRWGDTMGTIPADHFDEVGQLFGVTGPNFDHLEFYLEVVRELAGRDL